MAVRDLTQRVSAVNLADLAHQHEDERLQAYARAWAAYDGEGPLPLADEDGQADDNVRLAYPQLIVDKGVSFLAGKGGVEFQLDPVTDDEDADDEPPDDIDPDANLEARRERDEALARAQQEARAVLDDAWPEEQRHVDFHMLATNGGVCGHAWLRLHEDAALDVIDPETVTVDWSEDNFTIVERYLIEWNALDKESGLAVARRERIEPDSPKRPSSWTSHFEQLDPDTGEWVPIEVDEDGEEIVTHWDHAYPPLLGTQNLPAPNTYYGQPDLTPAVLALCEQLESVASDMRRIVRLHGHPIPVFTGTTIDQVRELDAAIGEIIAVPSNSGNPIGFDTLEVAELTSSLALYRELKSALFEAVKIPRVALGDRDKSGATTGVALQIEYAPLVEVTDTKRLMYGRVLRQAAEYTLDLRGLTNWRVTLGWPNILPVDDQAAAETAEADLRMGVVSKRTVSEKRGYDWKVERERIEEERIEAQRRFDAGLSDDRDDPADVVPPPDDDPDVDEE